jgi:nitrogen fixation-related uncharacterized protein
VQLAVTRIEPWSAFKMSLLLSTAAAVGFIVGTVLLWSVLKGMGVYDDIDGVIKNLQSNTSDPFSIMDYIGLGRVTSLAMVIGVVDVVLLTALPDKEEATGSSPVRPTTVAPEQEVCRAQEAVDRGRGGSCGGHAQVGKPPTTCRIPLAETPGISYAWRNW